MEEKEKDRRRHSRLLLPVIVVIVFAMVLATCMPMVMAVKPVKPPVTSDFTLKTLDSSGSVGGFTKVVAGGLDNAVHITYYDSTNHALKYATNKGGTWTLKVLAIVGDGYNGPAGGLADLALDAAGNVHIIYIDIANKLQYINNVGGSFSDPIWLGGDDVMGQPCLAIDSVGMLHVCFWESDLDGNWIIYAHGSPGAMTPTQVIYGDNNHAISWYMSMAVDSNDIAHMIYISLDDRVLNYTNSLDWKKTVQLPGVDIHANLAIGPGNSVHLSYFTNPGYVLSHAVLDGGSFVATVVTSALGNGVHYSGIAIDASGKVHISYMDYPAKSFKPIIKYATNLGGAWTTKVVDGASNAGTYNDIAVGPGAKVHIAYYGLSTSDLKYAESI